MSHILIETLFLVTFRMLKPTVGIMSSTKSPPDTTFTNDVFPAFCNPTRFPDVTERERERKRKRDCVSQKIPRSRSHTRKKHHHLPERRGRSSTPRPRSGGRSAERETKRKKETKTRSSTFRRRHLLHIKKTRERDIFPSSSPIPIIGEERKRQIKKWSSYLSKPTPSLG